MRNRQLYLTINPCRVLGSSCQCSNRTRPSAAKPYMSLTKEHPHLEECPPHLHRPGQILLYWMPTLEELCMANEEQLLVIENSCAMRNIMLHFTKGHYSIEGHILPLRVLQAITNWASKFLLLSCTLLFTQNFSEYKGTNVYSWSEKQSYWCIVAAVKATYYFWAGYHHALKSLHLCYIRSTQTLLSAC